MVDMAPKLLQQIQSDWSDNLKNDAEIKSLIEKINEGKATYKEVEDLSYRVGKDLSKSLLDNITEDILPNGHVPQNVAEKILHPTLNNAHNLVTNVAIKVQSDMNNAADIGLRAQKTDYDKDRAQGLVHKLTNGQFEDTKWILDEPVTLFVQSVADNTLKKNVDFQAHSGLKPQIIRKASSKCCDWCEDLEGTYDYGSEPKDVYRRHERCKCSVDYNPGTGKRQDVWSKAWHEDVDKDKIEQRIEKNKLDLDYKNGIISIKETKEPSTAEMTRRMLAGKQNPNNKGVIAQRIIDKEYSLKLKHQKYLQHIEGTKQNIQTTKDRKREQSVFYISEKRAQELIYKYAGTGDVSIVSNGIVSDKEYVSVGEIIGKYFEKGEWHDTSRVQIRYGKEGSHIVPVKEK